MIAWLTERTEADVHSDILKGELSAFNNIVKTARKALYIEDRLSPPTSVGKPGQKLEVDPMQLKGHDEPMQAFSGGAQREPLRLAYDDMPFGMIDRVARIAHEGMTRYGPSNWRRGIPINNFFNHAIEHLRKWHMGDTSEDHLAKACWNILAMMNTETHELDDRYWEPKKP